ncbi:MAG: hypothetical protein NC401_19090 [Ruminococcus sp.]|nr:hypothetical protein [Ruminococcus sp.]
MSADAAQFEELYKEVCEERGKPFSGNDMPNEIWNAMVTSFVCKECFAEILKECGKSKREGRS